MTFFQGVPRPSVPRQNKPRRVDLYYSSWCIRPGTILVTSQLFATFVGYQKTQGHELNLSYFIYQLNQEKAMVQ